MEWPVFVMRPATSADVPAVTEMILARSAWLEERAMPGWREYADDLASQAGASDTDMWVLEDRERGRVVGCTTVQETAPPWGWTEEEFAQPAHYLYTTCTDPEYREAKPGALIAWWATDRAAREGKAWVRRGCYFQGLVRYYERQGFGLMHVVQRKTRKVYLLGRPAEPIPGLDAMFASAAGAAEALGR